MKGFAVFFAVLIVLGLVFLKEKNHKTSLLQLGQSANPAHETKLFSVKPTKEEMETFDKKLQYEVNLISQVNEDPQSTEERLRDFSKSLKDTEIQALYVSSLNLQKPQDERFLSVTLLSWSQKAEVAELLEKIALSETDPYLSTGRNAEFEAVLRMKAVEGLIDLPLSSVEHQRHLQNIIQKSSSPQVADRAQRSLWALAGEADRPEVQDEKALKEMLEKTPVTN